MSLLRRRKRRRWRAAGGRENKGDAGAEPAESARGGRRPGIVVSPLAEPIRSRQFASDGLVSSKNPSKPEVLFKHLPRFPARRLIPHHSISLLSGSHISLPSPRLLFSMRPQLYRAAARSLRVPKVNNYPRTFVSTTPRSAEVELTIGMPMLPSTRP